jgi:hypothetical protein
MAFAGLAAACSSDLPRDAPIHLVLDTESIESGCSSEFCEDYAMSCGAMVSIRLTDPDTGAQLERATGEPLALCVEAPVSETICSLSELNADLQLFGMPARTVRFEVALWNGDDLLSAGLPPGSCPTPGRFELFDVQGRPKDYSPQPAFAGAAYFRAGEQAEVTVPLACPNPQRLNVDTCAANLPTEVEAFVTDMGTMQRIRDRQAPTISVAMGETRTVSDNAGGSFSVLEPIDIYDLRLDTQGVTPVYTASIQRRFGGNDKLACSTTLEGAAQATTTVFCEEVPDKAAELTLSPVLIRKATVDSVLAAIGATEFPESGLVIGRVVNEGFSPSTGVAVTPSEGSVQYLSEDLSDVTPTLTSASAYFVATDVPDGATWTASHFDGRRHTGSPRGGLIQGKVSAVIIRMTGDVVGP